MHHQKCVMQLAMRDNFSKFKCQEVLNNGELNIIGGLNKRKIEKNGSFDLIISMRKF